MGSVVDHTDGLSMEFSQWRFNLRSSNTKPVLRLNVEFCGDECLLREKTAELLSVEFHDIVNESFTDKRYHVKNVSHMASIISQ